MKLKIVETRNFSKVIDSLIKKRHLLKKDFIFFKEYLAENPGIGLVIPSTGGIRKIRLKSSSKGKSGGFRICYYYLVGKALYLILVYSKNERENLTMKQKQELKLLVKSLKGTR